MWNFRMGLVQVKIEQPILYSTSLPQGHKCLCCAADICAAIALESVSATQDHFMASICPPHKNLDFPLDELVAWKNGILAKHWDAVFPNGV